MKEQTIYIPTPISQKPAKVGWYYVMNSNMEIFPSMLRFVNGEFENFNELRVFFWLNPTTTPQELAGKDKEIEKRAHEYLDLEMELKELKELKEELAERDKQIVDLKESLASSGERIANNYAELAAKDKEIAEIKAFSKQAIELLTDNHKLEIEELRKSVSLLHQSMADAEKRGHDKAEEAAKAEIERLTKIIFDFRTSRPS